MGRSLVSCFLLTVLCVLAGCQELPADVKAPGCCPQEMCLFVFDRLEEQTQRWRIVEEALRRTVTLLSSNEQFAALSSTLKADPVVGSLFLADESNVVPDSPDWRVVDPILSLVQDESKFESIYQGGRTKRQATDTILIARERVSEALLQARLRSTTSRPPTTSTRDDGDVDQSEAGPNPLARMMFQVTTARPASSRQQRAPSDEEFDLFNNATINATSQSSSTISPTVIVPQEITTVMPTTRAPARFETTKSNLKEGIITTTTTPLDPQPQQATQQFVKESVNNLQSAAKCALGQRNELSASEFLGLLSGPQATLNPNGTVTVEFELKTCQKHFAAVWLLLEDRRATPIVYNGMRNKRMDDPSSSILQVPKDCLTRRGNVFSLTWPSPARRSCSFPLIPLMECRVYSIEILPIFQGFQGQSQTVTFTVPPLGFTDFNNGSLPEPPTSLSLSSLTATPRMDGTVGLNLQWSVQSEECAQLISSVDVRIHEDGAGNPWRSYTVPAECFSKPGWNSFTVENDYCNTAVAGMPLEKCRNYKVEVEPKYSSTWSGRSSLVDYFSAVRDENSCCNYLTSSSGNFQSVNYDGKFDCSWLISVDPQNVIWLTFSQFQIESYYYHVKVYDGRSASSNLLLDHYGYQPPQPVRSSSNKLFVLLAHQYYDRQSYGKYFTAYYSSVPNTGRPFVNGCGGFIYGTGSISKPAYPSTENSTSECVWYIESNSNSTVVLNNQGGKSWFPMLVYDGWSEEGLVVYSTGTQKAAIYSLSSKMLVKFPSWNSADRDRTYSWNVQNVYNNVSGLPCSYNLTASSGTIKSPNYPSTYSNSVDCRWVIQTNSTSKVRLTFGYFDTEQDYDFVIVYDGDSIFSPVLSEMSGSVTSPVTVTSTRNQMTIRFVTNAYTDTTNNNGYSPYGYVTVASRSGFLALYSAVQCDNAAS